MKSAQAKVTDDAATQVIGEGKSNAKPSRLARLFSSSHARVLSAMLTVGSLSLFAKLAVAGKDVFIARRFGTLDELDAFLVAYTVPLFATVVVCGSFNAALIPTLVATRDNQGRAAAQALFSTVMVFTMALLLAVGVLLGMASPMLLPLFGSSFDAQKLALTRSLFITMLPLLVLSGMTTIWSGVMNAESRFALPAIAPLLSPIAVVVSLFVTEPSHAVRGMAFATVIGALLEAAVVGFGVYRLGYSTFPRWHGFSQPVRDVLGQYVPMVAGSAVLSSSGLISQAFAGALGGGSIASLNYGTKVVSFVAGIASLSIGTAVFPRFSGLVAARNAAALRSTLRFYTLLVLGSLVPVTVVLMIASPFLVRLCFERGAFTAADTAAVVPIQRYFLLQLPFYSVGTLFVRMVSAFRGNSMLLRIAIGTLAIHISLGYLLTRHMGVAGIAASTSLMYMFSSFCAGWACWRLLRDFERKIDVSPQSNGPERA